MKLKLFVFALFFMIPLVVVQADCYQLIRQPAINHISIVIDRSGSMQGSPLADTKLGAKAFVERIKLTDRASIIEFGSDVSLAQSETGDKTSLYHAIDSLKANGVTALYDAVVRATLLLIR